MKRYVLLLEYMRIGNITLLLPNLTYIGSILIERYINIDERFFSPVQTMCQIEGLNVHEFIMSEYKTYLSQNKINMH